MSEDHEHTASLMTPARLEQLQQRPVAGSPAAWLDQLAADAGSGHVRRLLELCGPLRSHLAAPDLAPVHQAVAALAAALAEVDCSLLQPAGWLARLTGKATQAAAGFAAQVERGERAGEDLTDELRSVQRRQQAAGAIGRTLLELGGEVRAIDRIIDQGTRWLQDMSGQLQARQAAGGDGATLQKIREDGRRCELLAERLQQLRAARSTAHHVLEHGRATAERRTALIAALQRIVETDWPLAAGLLAGLGQQRRGSGRAAQDVLDAARQVQLRVRTALDDAGADAASLQLQEAALLQALSALQAPLQAAA
jgi:hypothetical protein